MQPEHMKDAFQLCSKQLHQAFELAEAAAAGDYTERTTPHRTVVHLLGICAYVHELMADMKVTIEEGD